MQLSRRKRVPSLRGREIPRVYRAGYFIPVIVALIAFVSMGTLSYLPGKGVSVEDANALPIADNDFVNEARMLYRIAACTGEDPSPPGVSEKVIEEHCVEFKRSMENYAENYVKVMKPFIAKHRPGNLPSTVIYPFGGGDLLTALTTYPDATEFYTLSLEQAGDVRKIHGLESEQARGGLDLLRKKTKDLIGLDRRLTATISTNADLKATQRGPIPGQITLFLTALAIHGYEPVSLRYFDIDEGGNIGYLGVDDIAAMEGTKGLPLSEDWATPDFSAAFSHCELQFKPRGKSGPVRVHRHIAANVANDHFHRESPVFRHLMNKGSMAAMTKGALYLLWNDKFSNIRDYLIDQADFMISDSTGLSPLHAVPAGFVYTTFGRFEWSDIARKTGNHHGVALRDVFQHQPYRPMPGRYGYIDTALNSNMYFIHKGQKAIGKPR